MAAASTISRSAARSGDGGRVTPVGRRSSRRPQARVGSASSGLGLPGRWARPWSATTRAYGHSVGESVARVRTRDRSTGLQRTYAAADCALAPRTGVFRRPRGSAVLDVTFLLRQGDLSEPVRDEQFARMAAGITLGERLRPPECGPSCSRRRRQTLQRFDADRRDCGRPASGRRVPDECREGRARHINPQPVDRRRPARLRRVVVDVDHLDRAVGPLPGRERDGGDGARVPAGGAPIWVPSPLPT